MTHAPARVMRFRARQKPEVNILTPIFRIKDYLFTLEFRQLALIPRVNVTSMCHDFENATASSLSELRDISTFPKGFERHIIAHTATNLLKHPGIFLIAALTEYLRQLVRLNVFSHASDSKQKTFLSAVVDFDRAAVDDDKTGGSWKKSPTATI